MRLLLDTHIFLWYIGKHPQLQPDIRDIVRDPDNEVYLSTASVWECIIKHQLGKLPLPDRPEIYLPLQRERHQMASLPIDETSMTFLALLPPYHRDPFDRILVAQALHLGLTLVTVDDAMRAYPVPILALAERS